MDFQWFWLSTLKQKHWTKSRKVRNTRGKKLFKRKNDGIKSTCMTIIIFKCTSLLHYLRLWLVTSFLFRFPLFPKTKSFLPHLENKYFLIFSPFKRITEPIFKHTTRYPQLLCTIFKTIFEKITKYWLTNLIQHAFFMFENTPKTLR